ncbi:GNAT family N-acetyltransferase [Streptomyces albidoflavus]
MWPPSSPRDRAAFPPRRRCPGRPSDSRHVSGSPRHDLPGGRGRGLRSACAGVGGCRSDRAVRPRRRCAGDLVGVVKLSRRPNGHGRVCYALQEDCWDRGYATKAVEELIVFAFAAAGLDSLGAKHHPGNPMSGRVLEKAGFMRLGIKNGMAEYRLTLA